MDDDFKKFYREMKILRAKKEAGGFFHPKDAKRLAWLEERLGDAAEVVRHEVDEPVQDGPTTQTSDDHWATEISEELLAQAEDYEPEKDYEKEEKAASRAWEARDKREGKATFKQEGLSQFAIEATEDMKEDVGLAEAPQEEKEGAIKQDHHRAVHASDESERLTKKSEKGKSNPFALDISDGLNRGLDKYGHFGDSVPDTAAKSWEVDVGEDEAVSEEATTRAVPAEELSEELRGLLRKSNDPPRNVDTVDDGVSLGERTTHQTDDDDTEALDLDLMRDALQYAEDRGLVEDEGPRYATDDEGRDLEVQEEGDDLAAAAPAAKDLPMPSRSATETFHGSSITAVNEPPAAVEEPAPTTEIDTSDMETSGVDTQEISALTSKQADPDGAEDDELGVLIPPPPPPPEEAPKAPETAQPASPSQPDYFSKATTKFEIGEGENPEELVLIPDPPPEEPATLKRARFADENPTRPGVAVEAPQDAIDTEDGVEVVIPSVADPDPSSVDTELHEVSDEMILAEPPDLSHDPEVDLDIVPEAPEIELEPEIPEPVEASEPFPEDGSGVAIEVELENVSARERTLDPDDLGDSQSGEELDIDQFWGLSDEGASAETDSIPAPPQTATQEVPSPPEPAPAQPAAAGRPLPSLGASAVQAPSPEQPTKFDRPRPQIEDERAPQDHGFLDSLFDEGGAKGEAGGRLPTTPPAMAPRPTRQPATSVPQRRFTPMPTARRTRGAATANDLRGPRKATVHFKDGVTRRGVIGQVDTDVDLIRLDPQSGSSAPPEDLVALSLKTIFLMLPRGTAYPDKTGPGVRVILIDGRSLEGFTPDYDAGRKAFTMFPKVDRGNIERVVIFNDAIKNIWFEE